MQFFSNARLSVPKRTLIENLCVCVRKKERKREIECVCETERERGAIQKETERERGAIQKETERAGFWFGGPGLVHIETKNHTKGPGINGACRKARAEY